MRLYCWTTFKRVLRIPVIISQQLTGIAKHVIMVVVIQSKWCNSCPKQIAMNTCITQQSNIPWVGKDLHVFSSFWPCHGCHGTHGYSDITATILDGCWDTTNTWFWIKQHKDLLKWKVVGWCVHNFGLGSMSLYQIRWFLMRIIFVDDNNYFDHDF